MRYKMVSKRILILFAIILSISIILTSFLGINYFIIKASDNIKVINYAYLLPKVLEVKNVSTPFPDSIGQIDLGLYYNQDEIRDYYFNLPIEEFYSILQKKYTYSKDYDCKYWSYVWSVYYVYNKDKYNWDLEYVDTNNHIFVMLYNESGYCIADLDRFDCYMQN